MNTYQGAGHIIEKTARVLQDFQGYLKAIVDGAIETVPEGPEREEFAAIALAKNDAAAPAVQLQSTPPKGPGRAWTVDEVAALARKSDLPSRSLESGRNLFVAGACAACHRVGTLGGTVGPDLTTLASRFSIREIAESILEPGKVISDQYAFTMITDREGNMHMGRIVQDSIEVVRLATDPYDLRKTVDILTKDIAERKLSEVSPMPPALIYGMNEGEVLDLLAFLTADRSVEVGVDSIGKPDVPEHIAYPDPDPNPEYTEVIVSRADKIVEKMEFDTKEQMVSTRDLIVAQYRGLSGIHDARDAGLETEADSDRKAAIRQLSDEQVKALHAVFLNRLAALDLSASQIDSVKNGMTYGVLNLTYSGYLDLLPELTQVQKATVMHHLVEARELAMDGGTSKEKHAIFNKYKGRINNYLSQQGYDLKAAETRRKRGASE